MSEEREEEGFSARSRTFTRSARSSEDPNDQKISKLVRVISWVESKEAFDTAVQKVIRKLRYEEDVRYVLKSFTMITVTLADAFKGLASGLSWADHGVEGLARLLIEMHQAIERHEQAKRDRIPNWMTDYIIRKAKVHVREEGRPRVLCVVHDVFIQFLTGMPTEDIYRLAKYLLKTLENVDSSWAFKFISTLFAHCMTLTRGRDKGLFADFIDVVVGWMVDESMADQSEFCDELLQFMSPYFKQEVNFATTLIKQIVEAVETDGAIQKLKKNDEGKAVKRVFLLAQAYSSLQKLNCIDDKVLVTNLAERFFGMASKLLTEVPDTTETKDLLVKLSYICNDILVNSSGADGPNTRAYIQAQLLRMLTSGDEWDEWSWCTVRNIFQGLTSWLEGVITSTQLTDETAEIARTIMSLVDKLGIEYASEKVSLTQALLRTRNASLLQEVWNWHLQKLRSLKTNQFDFFLAGIADIACNKSSAILTLYALDPSIFHVLLNLMKSGLDSARRTAVLKLLKHHCSVHSHWVSSLLKSSSNFATKSPASRFLPSLIEFWLQRLDSNISVTSKNWILEWIYEFLESSSIHSSGLLSIAPDFFIRLLRFICLFRDTNDNSSTPALEPETPSASDVDDGVFPAGIILQKDELPANNAETTISNQNEKERAPTPVETNWNYDVEIKFPDRFLNRRWNNNTIWPYLHWADKFLSLFSDPRSPYVHLCDIRDLLYDFCKDCLFNKSSSVPQQVGPLIVRTLSYAQPLLISELHVPWSLAEKETMMNWTAKANKPPETDQDYERILVPAEFYAILVKFFGDIRDTEEDERRGKSRSRDSGTSNKGSKTCKWPKSWIHSFLASDKPIDKSTDGVTLQKSKGKKKNMSFLDKVQEGKARSSSLKATADYLMRSKLKTPLGKAPDFFSQIHELLKRKETVPEWKFEFLFLLEQCFTLWSSGTNLMHFELPENVQSFFSTNRGPLTEWLKRLRSDMVERALACGYYHHALFHASLAEDVSKFEISSCFLEDPYILGQSDPWSRAGWKFVNGDFEGANNTINTMSEEVRERCNEGLLEVVALRCQAILSVDFTEICLNDSSQPLLLMDYVASDKQKKTILDSQISSVQNMRLQNFETTFSEKLLIDMDQDKYNIWTLIKSSDFIRGLPHVIEDEKRELWLKLASNMIENGNVNWGTEFLAKLGVRWSILRKPGSLPCCIHDSHDDETFLCRALGLAGKILIQKGQLQNAAELLSHLLKCVILSGSEDFWKFDLLSQIAEDFGQQGKHLISILEDMGMDDEVSEMQATISIPSNELEFHPISIKNTTEEDVKRELGRQVLYLKGVQLWPNEPKCWLQLGNAYFEFYKRVNVSETSRNLADPSNASYFKTKSAYEHKMMECFCKYLRMYKEEGTHVSPKDCFLRDQNLALAISRVITLIKKGIPFPSDVHPSEIITHQKWIHFLPEIAQTPQLRELMYKRFPATTALYLWPHTDAARWSKAHSCFGRKSMFDPLGSDWGEPSTDGSKQHSCSTCQGDPPAKEPKLDFELSSPVHKFAKELLRLGTSYEEMWSFMLRRIAVDWKKQESCLKKDYGKNADVGTVCTYFAPICDYLSELWQQTVDNAEAPVEISFIARNCDKIAPMIAQLRYPQSFDHLRKSFDNLLFYAETFESRPALKIQLNQISLTLTKFKDWGVSDPLTVLGLPAGVRIADISTTVFCLPTKTRPKKVTFLGSNGKNYDFLVKGNENLNVDSAMMQLFSTIQGFLEKPIWTYAVTPLGNRGGLIQMVPFTVPIFHLYKKHIYNTNPGEKTSDLFWKKLKALNYNVGKSRDNIESGLLKLAFKDLCEESPPDLIKKEILLTSPTVQAWYNNVSNYTQDMGVASTIGALLGIGDRHLDNILLDPRTGSVIHVDFSVVFWKGEKLRVPEIVPFRLTRNFAEALMFPGTKGAFRNIMETSLRTCLENVELLAFCGKTIAFAFQLEDSLVISYDTASQTAEARCDFIRKCSEQVEKLVNRMFDRQLKMIGGKNSLLETVDSLVEDATNVDQLSKMFEGWTAWI